MRLLGAALALAAAAPAAVRATEPGDDAPAAPAPAAPAEADRAEFPFAGVVLGDDVNLRAGPGANYEVVTKLAGGEKVQVIGEAFGWLVVRPVREVRTFVHKDLIATKGAGVGIVLKDRVNLRSRPAAEATVVGQCARGDVVRLVDATGDWIAVVAPPEASFYVHRDLVRPCGGAADAALPAAPTAPADAAPLVAPEKARRARELYLAELEKPDLDTMDFAPALALFEQALKDAEAPEVRRAAEDGIRRIRAARTIQEDYRRKIKPIGDMLKR
jgi:SH3-like domain-containing protein